MFAHLKSAREEICWSSRRPPRRLAHRRVAQFVFEHDLLAVHVKSAEPPGRAAPARPIGRKKLNVAVDFRRVEQSESRGIELQETAGPTGPQVEVDRVETNAGLSAVANSNGERPCDGAVGHTERRGEKLAHIGPAPAIVDPVL